MLNAHPGARRWSFALALVATACSVPVAHVADAGPGARTSATAADATPAISAAPAPPKPAAIAAGQSIRIPAGSLRVGSRTGSRSRDPSREADASPLTLPAFAIDLLPYPNDPAIAPRTKVSLSEARALCSERAARLCSELEWERACKGPDDRAYPWAGETPPDPATTAPSDVRSSEGVAGMGLWGREWTDSRASNGVGDGLRTAVVRGAPPDAPARLHRCAARDAATPDSRSEALTFRCCQGVPSIDSYPQEHPESPLEAAAITATEARTLLAKMPGTQKLAAGFSPFAEADVQRVLASMRAAKTSLAPWQPAWGLVSWSPVPRERIQVLAGDAPQGAALVVFYPDVDGEPQLITSYETRGEHTPIVLASRPDDAKQLLFSTCWGCGGEGAALTFGDDALVRLDPR